MGPGLGSPFQNSTSTQIKGPSSRFRPSALQMKKWEWDFTGEGPKPIASWAPIASPDAFKIQSKISIFLLPMIRASKCFCQHVCTHKHFRVWAFHLFTTWPLRPLERSTNKHMFMGLTPAVLCDHNPVVNSSI